jgi:ectonucleoside triphosphate diphosphohydrolase 5/6
MAGSSNVRQRRNGAGVRSSAAVTTVSTRAAAARPATPPLSADDEIANATTSLLTYALVCVGIGAVFVGLALTTPLDPPSAVRAVMIDAGSTGTRAQLFTFSAGNGTDHSLSLVSSELHEMPASLAALGLGISGSGGGVAFFKPLVDKLKAIVPNPKRRAVTPIILRATAGLRLLGTEAANAALGKAAAALKASGFLFRDHWVTVLDERDEGVHAWTTVNYLLGRFEGGATHGTPRVGIMDLGGGSVQIVFPSDVTPDSPAPLSASESRAGVPERTAPTVVFARVMSERHRVLAKSHLGQGLFDFSKKLYYLLDRENVLETGNPCFRKGRSFPRKALRIGTPGSSEEETRVVDIAGAGNFDRCVSSVEIVLDGFSVPAPAAIALARNTEFYAFAYFYERTVGLGLSETATPAELAAKGRHLCEDESSGEAADELCGEFSYVYALLKRLSSDFDPEVGVTFRFVQYIDGHMLGWALGAAMEELSDVARLQIKNPIT